MRHITSLACLTLLFATLAHAVPEQRRGGPPPRRETVALLPTSIFSAHSENREALDRAFRASLTQRGHRLAPEEAVKRALEERDVELPAHLQHTAIARLGQDLGMELIVYPRVLNIGVAPPPPDGALDPARLRAVILITVLEAATGRARVVSQVTHEWTSPNPNEEKQVIPASAAEEAVAKALKRFYDPDGG